MKWEKIGGAEVGYRYILEAEEVKDFTGNRNAPKWAILEVYPDLLKALIHLWEGEDEPTAQDIAAIRDWAEEDFEKVAFWLHKEQLVPRNG